MQSAAAAFALAGYQKEGRKGTPPKPTLSWPLLFTDLCGINLRSFWKRNFTMKETESPWGEGLEALFSKSLQPPQRKELWVLFSGPVVLKHFCLLVPFIKLL